MTNEFFDSKYPIVCLPMNGVSDANLAIAVANAGVVPSLFLHNYLNDTYWREWKELLAADLERFRKEAGNANIVLSFRPVGFRDMIDIPFKNKKTTEEKNRFYKNMVLLIMQHKISHLEFLGFDVNDATQVNFISVLRKHGIKTIYKSNFYPDDPSPEVLAHFDAVSLKSNDAAGRVVNSSLSMQELIAHCCKYNPQLKIIACGGIGNKRDIDHYLEAGAHYVGIGTLFALSKESKIVESTKKAMIENKKLSKLDSGSMKQNAIVFDTNIQTSDANNTDGLLNSISGNGGSHIFCGTGISEVNNILPVSAIVKRLTDNLYQ